MLDENQIGVRASNDARDGHEEGKGRKWLSLPYFHIIIQNWGLLNLSVFLR